MSEGTVTEDAGALFLINSFEQIVLGRYNSGGNIQTIHLVILGSSFIAMMFIYIVFLRRRLVGYRKKRNLIPPETLPLMKEDLGRDVLKRMLDHILFVDNVVSSSSRLQPERNSSGCTAPGDPGWDKRVRGEVMEEIHYNTYVATSYLTLEKAALSRRPGLYHTNCRTIREYVLTLQTAFPALLPQLCAEYIHSYELAVFSSYTFSASQFERFQKVLSSMAEIINE
jgi:hypothetical protein